MSDITQRVPPEGSNNSLLFITQLVYILHGLSMLIGLMTGATIISAFLFGWPSIAAVVLNYVKAPDARGTFLESHFSWQIRTFWYGMVWTLLVMIAGVVLMPFIIGPFVWLGGFVVLSIWVAYRIIFGWLRLREYRPVFSD